MTVTDDFLTLDSCEIPANWTPSTDADTPTLDSETYKEGSGSLNLGKSGTMVDEFYYEMTFSALDLTNKFLVFWLYVENGDVLGKITENGIIIYDSQDNWQRAVFPPLVAGWNARRYCVNSYNRVYTYDEKSATLPVLTDIVKVSVYFKVSVAGDTITHGKLKMDYWHYGTKFIVTGFPYGAVPYRFIHIYNHDFGNAIGLVEHGYNAYQFTVFTSIDIGDGSTTTFFKSEMEYIEFPSSYLKAGSKSFYSCKLLNIRVKNNATFQVGNMIEGGEERTYYGSTFKWDGLSWSYFLFENGATGNLYQTFIDIVGGFIFYAGSYCKLRDVYVRYGIGYTLQIATTNADLKRVRIHATGAYALALDATPTLAEDIVIHNAQRGVSASGNPTFKNLRIEDCTLGDIYPYITSSVTCINSYFDESKVQSRITPYEWTMYRQWTINLKVVDKDGTPIEEAAVKIWDKFGTLVCDEMTDVNGEIPEQTITCKTWFHKRGDPVTQLTITDYNPHKMEISASGYQKYETTMEIIDIIDWEITPPKGAAPDIIFVDGKPALSLEDPENELYVAM